MTNGSLTRVIFDAASEGTMRPDAIAERFTPGMHRIIFNELDERGAIVWDENGRGVVRMVVEGTDLDVLEKLHRDEVVRTGSHSAASVSVAVERFGDDLPAYIRALNISARLSEEMPKNGTWIGALTEDLYHWADMGIRFPAELAAHLDAEFEREMQKEMAY